MGSRMSTTTRIQLTPTKSTRVRRCVCVRAVRACVRACVRAFVRAGVRAFLRVCECSAVRAALRERDALDFLRHALSLALARVVTVLGLPCVPGVRVVCLICCVMLGENTPPNYRMMTVDMGKHVKPHRRYQTRRLGLRSSVAPCLHSSTWQKPSA
jgi:hypothetical protein